MQLDKRLSCAKQQINKIKKLESLKEQEVQSQLQEKPVLTSKTQKIAENLDVKNVFERQRILTQTKEAIERQNRNQERYNILNGITNKPEINPKSRSMQRTVDDLYNWQTRRDNKINHERNKEISPPKIVSSNRPKSTNKYDNMAVEDRLLTQGLKTQQKIKQKIKQKEEEEESVQQSSIKISYTYPSKQKTGTFHTHYVDTEASTVGRNELLDPIKETLNMTDGRTWAELTLLERNQMFINNRKAKLEYKREVKKQQEVANCSFEPKLTNFNPKRLEIVPLIEQDPEAEKTISTSLERILAKSNKNKGYSEIHSERLRQRSLERE